MGFISAAGGEVTSTSSSGTSNGPRHNHQSFRSNKSQSKAGSGSQNPSMPIPFEDAWRGSAARKIGEDLFVCYDHHVTDLSSFASPSALKITGQMKACGNILP